MFLPNLRFYHKLACGAAMLMAAASASAQTPYAPNGNSGFGGNLGQGQGLTVSNDGQGGVNFSLSLSGGGGGFGGGSTGNDVVIYVDTGAGGGISSTSTLTDTGDGGRQATSGVTTTMNSSGAPNRSTLNFGGVLTPQYGIDLGQYYGQVLRLTTPSLTQTDGASPGSTGTNGLTYAISGNVATIDVPAADLGLTPNSGATLQLFATYISEDAYRSNEAIGTFVSGNATLEGYGVDQTVATDFSFSTVPEPSTWVAGAFCFVVAARFCSVRFRASSPLGG